MRETEIKASEIPEGSEGYWERSGGGGGWGERKPHRDTQRQVEHTTAALAWIPGGGGDSEGWKRQADLPSTQASNLVTDVGKTVIPWNRVSGGEIPLCHSAAGPFYC